MIISEVEICVNKSGASTGSAAHDEFYFSIHREGHNLDRARTQLKLVADMERKWDEMQSILHEVAGI